MTRMKAYRILGIIWAAMCGFFAVFYAWERYASISTYHNKWLLSDMCLDVCIVLFCLAGALASGLLHRGKCWARRFVCFVAILSALYFGLGSVAMIGNGFGGVEAALFICISIYSLISVSILLQPSKMSPNTYQARAVNRKKASATKKFFLFR